MLFISPHLPPDPILVDDITGIKDAMVIEALLSRSVTGAVKDAAPHDL